MDGILTGRRARRNWFVAAATVTLIGGIVPLASQGSTGLAAAPYPAPVMTGYVPLEANATQKTMENANSLADTTLDFTVGITNAGAGAVMFYDHWEDGFEADLTNPVQGSTQVWGDGDTLNGNAQTYCGLRCAGDLLPAGAVFVLRNNVPTPRTTTILWDGRDRVSSTRGFTITAGGFSTPLGSVLSASASAYDTSKWGTDYWIPVGENMTPPSGTSDAFSTTSVQIMAEEANTVVSVDKDGNGTIDQSGTIGQGGVLFVDGGVNQGAHVTSTNPVQVHVGAGDAGAAYELRWFTLFPTPSLTNDYLNPVGSTVNTQRTITYVFNPGTAAITVNPSCGGCTPLNVPAKGTLSMASPVGVAVRFQSAGGEPFAAVGAGGSESGAAPGGGTDGSATYDWGFGLVPSRLLTSKAVLGWAPGNSANPPNVAGELDDDPVWIAAFTPTTIYIDYDGDPTTGALGPNCDGMYDEARSVGGLVSTKIFDAADGDMTGAAIYTCDSTKLAGAWGEDAAVAPSGSPGFDAGYALIPSTAMLVNKTAGLTGDTNSDGRFGPGDLVTYDISIADAGALSFTNLEVDDPIPAGTVYVPGSTTYEDGASTVPFADDIVPPAATVYPFDEGGAALPTINPGVTVHIRYAVQVANPFPMGTSITNTVVVGADQSSGGDIVTTNLLAADLSLAKSLTTTPTYIGQNATYLLTVSNAGPDAAPGVGVTDLLPSGLTFVGSTPSQGSYNSSNGVWSVGTIANGGSATLSITATVNVLSVTNSAEITASLAADPDSTPANASTTEDDDASVALTVQADADISLTKVRDSGPDASGDTTFTLTLSNAGPSTSTGVQVTDYPPTGATFVSATPQTSALADGTFNGVGNLWTVPDLAPGGQAQIHVVYNTPVAPGTNDAQVTAATTHDPDSAPSTTPLSSGNPPVQDDEASAGVPAIGDVSLTNVTTTPANYVGEVATFTVTVTNGGPTNTTGVMVTDLLPAGLQFVSSTPSVGTYNSSNGVWNIATMVNGAVVTLTIDARVTNPGVVTTTAQVTASTATDVDSTPGNNVPTEDDQADAAVTTTAGVVGDTVWFDLDGDFVVDTGETLLPGVTVNVRWAGPNTTLGDGDDVVTPVTTGSNGNWILTGLALGNYSVAVDPSSLPYGITTATRDRDGSGSANITTFALAGGQTLTDVDFAFVGSGVVGDTIYLDTVGQGIAGATVDLVWFGPDGVRDLAPGGDDVTSTTVTTGGGDYQFVNLPGGLYSVSVDPSSLPAGLRNSVDPDAGNDSRAAFGLTTGQSRLDLDFGYSGTNSIGDTVYNDIDGDGGQDAGEPGLGAVTITLRRDLDLDGTFETVVATTATGGNGTYLFDDLPGGSYRVDITAPSGLNLSTPAMIPVTVNAGQAITTADFGLQPPPATAPGTVGDRVWNDLDGDGIQDAGEPGIANASIALRVDTDGDGLFDTTVATQTTTADGAYGFANLPPGTYETVIVTPAGLAPTTPRSIVTALVAGASINTVDFGFTAGPVAPSTIGDRVWDDVDADGLQDGGEPGLSGVTVSLRRDGDGDGSYEIVVGTMVTDSSGNYSFTAVPPGNYAVVVTPAVGTSPTTSPSIMLAVVAGSTIDTADFGLTSAAVPPSSIGDRIWLDTNRDGVQDAGEPGVNGVTVTLRADNDHDGSYETTVGTTTTVGDGTYTFGSLPPGSYLVSVTPPNGLAVTVPSVAVTLAAGIDVVSADLGLAPPSAVPFDVQLVKSVQGAVVAGRDMTWLLVVSNNGIGATPSVMTVTDNLPAGLAYRSATGQGWACSATGQTVMCTGGGPLAAGQSSTIRIVTTVTATGGATISNTASVASSGVELTSANNTSAAQTLVDTPPPGPAPTVPVVLPLPEVVPTPIAALPTTGADSRPWMLIGASLILAGGLMLLATKRRAWSPVGRGLRRGGRRSSDRSARSCRPSPSSSRG